MKGDFSKRRHDPKKGYHGVLKQQGRVDLDADWNEYVDIREHHARTRSRDIIGRCGVLEQGGGFEISRGDDDVLDLNISPGRIYVDGILCELEEPEEGEDKATFKGQPYFVGAPPGTPEDLKAGDAYLVYLDVWDRHVSVVEDEDLIEPALRGPDTTTRAQTVWQVKLHPVDPEDHCRTELKDWPPVQEGPLLTNVPPGPKEKLEDPCQVREHGAYDGIENRLYRVEVHDPGKLKKATFKWSRDNGAVVYPVSIVKEADIATNRVEVKRLGRGQAITLSKGDMVELIDDMRDLAGEPGEMASVEAVNETTNTVTLDRVIDTLTEDHLRMRRWDHPRPESGYAPLVTRGPLELENNIEIEFSGKNFKTGDYWLFAARTATKEIELLKERPPLGIMHHYCKLAIIRVHERSSVQNLEDGGRRRFSMFEDPRGRRSSQTDPGVGGKGGKRGSKAEEGEKEELVLEIIDCRPRFPRLTELTSFFYLGGDGQEAMPGHPLPQPLRVGVSNGQWPVDGARVFFRIVQGTDGCMIARGPEFNEEGVKRLGETLEVRTVNGIAECHWSLGRPEDDAEDGVLERLVEATLVDEDGETIHQPIHFSASPSVASNVRFDTSGDCSKLGKDVDTVQEAIDALCRMMGKSCATTVGNNGEYGKITDAWEHPSVFNNVCLCLLPHEHSMGPPDIISPEFLTFKMTGCGSESSVVRIGGIVTIRAHEIVLKDMSFKACSNYCYLELIADRVVVAGCIFERLTVDLTKVPNGRRIEPFVTIRPRDKASRTQIQWSNNTMVSTFSARDGQYPLERFKPNSDDLPKTSTIIEDLNNLELAAIEGDLPTYEEVILRVSRSITRLGFDSRRSWGRGLASEMNSTDDIGVHATINLVPSMPGEDSDGPVPIHTYYLKYQEAVEIFCSAISKKAPVEEDVRFALRLVVDTLAGPHDALFLDSLGIEGSIINNRIKGYLRSASAQMSRDGKMLARITEDNAYIEAGGTSKTSGKGDEEEEVTVVPTSGPSLMVSGNHLSGAILPMIPRSGRQYCLLSVTDNVFYGNYNIFGARSTTLTANAFMGARWIDLVVATVVGTENDHGVFTGNKGNNPNAIICTTVSEENKRNAGNLLWTRRCKDEGPNYEDFYLQ